MVVRANDDDKEYLAFREARVLALLYFYFRSLFLTIFTKRISTNK